MHSNFDKQTYPYITQVPSVSMFTVTFLYNQRKVNGTVLLKDLRQMQGYPTFQILLLGNALVKTNFEYDKKISDQPISLFYLNEGCNVY